MEKKLVVLVAGFALSAGLVFAQDMKADAPTAVADTMSNMEVNAVTNEETNAQTNTTMNAEMPAAEAPTAVPAPVGVPAAPSY